ncbi:MGMT family protein [Streptomyces olivaceus]|nr:MGMT family protein [Streptomyces olivaceus]
MPGPPVWATGGAPVRATLRRCRTSLTFRPSGPETYIDQVLPTGAPPDRAHADVAATARGIVEDVREAVARIPVGCVASYGDIGERIGAGPRQVGRAMSLLDEGVPWWRVVYADGTPASCHGGRAPGLLRDEGTPMRGARVDMERARHRAPPSAP